MKDREIIQQPEFKKHLADGIEAYTNRPAPPTGKKYARHPFDTLKEKDMFNEKELLHQYRLMTYNRCRLSSAVRAAIRELFIKAARLYWKEMKEKEVKNEKGDR